MTKRTLADFLPESHITWLEEREKVPALRSMLGLLRNSRAVTDPSALENAILSREVMMSTGVGYGVAVPHARIPTVDEFVLALGISAEGVAYSPVIDDKPVRLIVMIAGPDNSRNGYLKLLSTLMRFIKSEKGKILSSTSTEEIRRFAARYAMELESNDEAEKDRSTS